MKRLRLAAASVCGMTAGLIGWMASVLDDEPDRWMPRTLVVLAGVAALCSGWLVYSAYRRPSSRRARIATGMALLFSAAALCAWSWTTVGVAWCSAQACGD